MKAYIPRPLVILLLLCQLLASCRSYRSLGERADPAPAAWASKVTPGKVYQVKLITGKTMRMQILRVDEKNLYGTLYTDNPAGKTLKIPNTALPLDQVADLQEKRFNPLLTAAVIVVPIALVVVLASQMDFNFNPFPNGIWRAFSAFAGIISGFLGLITKRNRTALSYIRDVAKAFPQQLNRQAL